MKGSGCFLVCNVEACGMGSVPATILLSMPTNEFLSKKQSTPFILVVGA